ncbi:hypothetical protein D1BOALGB6SA_10117 [Olavius sp. associated proteobacterium Delta 1]|nr:hypothetical protein D1BOALGB6SA_10117 [Olavius sp. associated proteobacterium Delta 1]
MSKVDRGNKNGRKQIRRLVLMPENNLFGRELGAERLVAG